MPSPDPPTTLFVYGSLLEETHREEILGRRVATAPAILRDFERGRSAHFYVRKKPGSLTRGLLLLALSPHDFAILDRYEEVPTLYGRERIIAEPAGGGRLECWIYLPVDTLLFATDS